MNNRGGPSQRSQISLHIPTPKLGPSLPPRNMSTVKRTAPTGQPSSPNSLASLLLLALASALARALERPMRNMAARTPCCVVETFWDSGGTSGFRWHLEAVTATPQRNSIGWIQKTLHTSGKLTVLRFWQEQQPSPVDEIGRSRLITTQLFCLIYKQPTPPQNWRATARHQLRPTAVQPQHARTS